MINLLHIDDEKFNLWISMVFGIKGVADYGYKKYIKEY